MPPPPSTVFADRLYNRLPEIYRTLDVDQAWLFKRYINAITTASAEVDDLVERIRGARPVGPAEPLPWGLDPDELVQWIEARASRPSALTDPDLADAAWLPWLAQLVGAQLDPNASIAEQRDTIRYATSGWRAGTRGAVADAARSALTGTRYAKVYPHMTADANLGLVPGTPWDVTVVTRATETPDVDAVLGAILRKGVKPAGVVLWHKAYEATWDTWEAVFPTWAEWDAATWDQMQEAGLIYQPIAGNLAVNPSFEGGVTGWAGRNAATVTQVIGGVDSTYAGRIASTTTATATGLINATGIPGLIAGRKYQFGMSVKPHTAVSGSLLQVDWSDSASTYLTTATLDVTPAAGQWNRLNGVFTAPANAARARLVFEAGVVPVGEYIDVDAVLFRETA